jgi:hypothetical protein
MKTAKAVWDLLSEGARFCWLEGKGFLPEQCRWNAVKSFDQLADSIQLLLGLEYD